jgi:hypothetical protein
MHAIQLTRVHRQIAARPAAISPRPTVGPSAKDASAPAKGSEQ